jgi:hypothetical protein
VTNDVVCAWHTELMLTHGTCDWRRIIITNWGGKPFESDAQVHAVVNWLAQSAHPVVFAARRGSSHVTAGVQIWCVNPETEFLVHMMAAPVKLVRSYTPDQFASQLELMLGWMVTP